MPLRNGVQYPTIALNTAGLSSAQVESVVLAANAFGIRHVDFHRKAPERDGVAREQRRAEERERVLEVAQAARLGRLQHAQEQVERVAQRHDLDSRARAAAARARAVEPPNPKLLERGPKT